MMDFLPSEVAAATWLWEADEVLAATIFLEAGDKPYRERVAVGILAVTRGRMLAVSGSGGIRGACLGHTYDTDWFDEVKWCFAGWGTGLHKAIAARREGGEAWNRCLDLAKQILAGSVPGSGAEQLRSLRAQGSEASLDAPVHDLLE